MKNFIYLTLVIFIFCFVGCSSKNAKRNVPLEIDDYKICELRQNTKQSDGTMKTVCLRYTSRATPCKEWRTERYNNGNSTTRCMAY